MMKQVIQQVLLLLFLPITFIISPAYGEIVSFAKTDSLRKVLETEDGPNKASVQLDLALQILEIKKDKATDLAKSSLEFAQKTGDKNLELRSYYVLGRIYQASNIELSTTYNDSALAISDEIDENWHKGEILFRQGMNQHKKGEDLKALESFSEALRACHLSENWKSMASTYSVMGSILRLNGLYDRALEYTIKSKLNYEKADFLEGNAWSGYLLGRIYADLGLIQTALEYFHESLNIYMELSHNDGNTNGIALCYEQIGAINLKSGNFDDARASIENVMEIYTKSDSEYGISNAFKNLGMIEYSLGNYKKAEDYLNRSLKIKNGISDLLNLPSVYEYLGLCMIETGRITEGFRNINQGLELAISNNQKKNQLGIYSKLAEKYLKINDLERAYSCQSKQIEIQNEIVIGSARIKVEQLQAIYEIDEKNKQIEELERQNVINSLRIKEQRNSQIIMRIVVFSVFLILVIIFLFYNKIRHKNIELKEANATKDKLFSIIAHDLRGPIGTVLGMSELFVEEIRNKNLLVVEKYSSIIHQSLTDTYNLLNNLLEWSQSQLQKIEFNPQKLLLYNVLDELKDLLTFRSNEKDIKIEINVDKNQQVFADETMLKTILRNLISNAIKFSNKNGEITVSANVKGKYIEISVQDEGVGMEPEIVKNLFNLESNSSTAGTSGEKGTGIGLVLVKEFVEKHGGKIKAESEKRMGSKFSFTLLNK